MDKLVDKREENEVEEKLNRKINRRVWFQYIFLLVLFVFPASELVSKTVKDLKKSEIFQKRVVKVVKVVNRSLKMPSSGSSKESSTPILCDFTAETPDINCNGSEVIITANAQESPFPIDCTGLCGTITVKFYRNGLLFHTYTGNFNSSGSFNYGVGDGPRPAGTLYTIEYITQFCGSISQSNIVFSNCP